MVISVQGRIGILLLLILGIVVGVAMLAGFSLPTVVVAVWLIIGSVIAIIGV